MILTKYEVRKYIFVEDPNIKFHENLSSGRRADTCGQTYVGRGRDGQTQRSQQAPCATDTKAPEHPDPNR